MADYERVLCVKNEVFVFKIPPRTTNRGYRAAEWTLDNPDWTGRMRVVALKKELTIKLEDRNSGELFASAPVEEYPGMAVEQVLDSSRYFVLQIKDPSGRKAFIGLGFSDRGDAFDLNVALQDHFKWVKRDEDEEKSVAKFAAQPAPKLDLGFKEGQTIKININTKRQGEEEGKVRPRAKAHGGGLGLLPPPPGTKSAVAVAPILPSQPVLASPEVASNTAAEAAMGGGVDLLSGLRNPTAPQQDVSTPAPAAAAAAAQPDPWGDFIGNSNANSGSSSSSSSNTNWMQF